MPFVHLHTHSHFSLLDGLSSPRDIVEIAKKQGAPAAALTDHGNMYGVWEFYQACLKEGVKPIVGCEVYVAKQDRHRRDPQLDKNQYHLILLAQNYQGYQNLMKLVSRGFIEGFYYKPRVDWELLKEYSKHLICSTACVQGELPVAIWENKPEEELDALVNKFKQTFPDRFFLEVQPLDFDRQQKVNQKMFELAQKHNLDVITTCDAHYPSKEDGKIADILARIQTGITIKEEAKIDIAQYNLYLRSREDFLEAFPDHPEVVENTLKVADMVDLEMPDWGWIFPYVDLPKKFKSNEDYLRALTYEGIENRLHRQPNEDEKKRIEYELDIINTKGFASYFITCQEITDYMHEHQIQTTTRGSAAGSLVSYSLGVTRANPLFFDLPFERFLNPLRPKAPDIDLDIADDRRDELIRWTVEKYGEDKVSQIVTFGTMAAKASFKDVARVYEIPFSETNEIAKLIPTKWGKSNLKNALEEVDELRQLYEENETYKQVFDIALRLEGKPRHASVHACGILITDKPITDYVPLSRDPRAETPVSQFDQRILEDLGLCKMDFLGVRNLSIIADCRQTVKERHGKDIDPEKLKFDDPKTFELLGNAETFGVFQLESAGMRRYLKELKPTTIFDIAAMVALYRPGPMENIPEYIARKHGQKPAQAPDPRLEKILDKSLGMIVYQDDVLLTAIELAGYDWGEVDKFRKAIGKKIPELMAAQHDKFVQGCVEHGGLNKEKGEELFELFAPFAGYGFNKSHAAAYSILAYQTAFFKANYPVEYMAALLKAEKGDSDKTTANMEECERMGITILPPSINESGANFTVIDDQTIRFGLGAVKNVGEGPVEEILIAREKEGSFKTLSGFARRVNIKVFNKRVIESLAWSGALDELGERKQIADNYQMITDFAKRAQKIDGPNEQISLFADSDLEPEEDKEDLQLPAAEAATRSEKMAKEKELLGMYVSENPLRSLKNYFQNRCCKIGSLQELIQNNSSKNNSPGSSLVQKNSNNNGSAKKIGGMITNLKNITTKNGDTMAFGQLESWCGEQVELVIFPRVWAENREVLEVNLIAIFTGKVDDKDGELKFLVDQVTPLDFDKANKSAEREQGKVENGQYEVKLELPTHFARSKMLKIRDILDVYPGSLSLRILVGKNEVEAKCKVDGSHDLLDKLKGFAGVKVRKAIVDG